MKQIYSISGMTCAGCEAKVQYVLSAIDGVKSVRVNLAKAQAEIESTYPIPAELLRGALHDYPKYQIQELTSQALIAEPRTDVVHAPSWWVTYKPLLLIVVYILLISLAVSFQSGRIDFFVWMNYFMAGFFLVFSFFKMLDLRAFAQSYAMYDIVAKKIGVYGFIYPFIELGLGMAYLLHWDPFFTNLFTVAVMGVGAVGVIQSVVNKKQIQCACLGTVFNLPMSTLTIIEDLLMVCMALVMLLLRH